ncbi:MAG: hypothetical protein C0626_00395 [Arcobacter sp.]|uniref:hypothetical protein n=1 Tax=uncultured Arcobacter sp. TaxID=165434 RepID=UPI000CC050E9|nr:hypothetical protein [uncultured Arcobacter sp.]PLY11066.1 MAG: hypothetical protein C0626_00395 [Arcobacter sp.]
MNRILLVILIGVILFFSYGIYSNLNKKSIKSKRVVCQQQTVTFESIYDKTNIAKVQKLFTSKNYIIKSNIIYSVFMPTVLKNNLNANLADDILKRNIPITDIIKTDEKLVIDYYIYENDKDDNKKKNPKAKLYAGYLLFEFKLNEKIVYKIQTDYMKQDGSDIENRIECVVKSFLSI